MRVLLTGSSGFLGRIIVQSLGENNLAGLNSGSGDIICNLSKNIPNLSNYDLVIHAAGKAHSVTKTQEQKKEFFDINVTGTVNLLKGLEARAVPKSFVFISTVAVYGKETGSLIIEKAPLLATDPYGKSKIQAEAIVENWCEKNNVICTILRLPLIAGANPPGNLKSMINGIKKGYYFDVASGRAKKSIVLAEDVARIIPVVARIGGTYNLTDGYHPSFHELSGYISKQLHRSKPANIPLSIAKLMAAVGNLIGNKAPINSRKLNKIISDLTFDDSKAVKAFGWNPTPVLQGFHI